MRKDKAPIAVGLALTMIGVSAIEETRLDLLTCAIFAVAGMVAFGCISMAHVRRSINLEVLVVVAAAFGISAGLVNR